MCREEDLCLHSTERAPFQEHSEKLEAALENQKYLRRKADRLTNCLSRTDDSERIERL